MNRFTQENANYQLHRVRELAFGHYHKGGVSVGIQTAAESRELNEILEQMEVAVRKSLGMTCKTCGCSGDIRDMEGCPHCASGNAWIPRKE